MKKIIPIVEYSIPFLFNLLFFLAPLIFFHKTSEVFEFNKMVFVYFATILILASWILKSIVYKKFIFKRTLLDTPILIFLLSQSISTILSLDQHTSLFGYYSRFHGGLLSTLCYSLLYWAYVSNMNKRYTLYIIRNTLYSAGLVAIYGALEHFGKSPSCLLITGRFDDDCWIQDVRNRVFATIGQPNWLAAWLVALTPLTWTLNLNINSDRKDFLRTTFYILLSTTFYSTLLFTKSRSGILGFIFAFIIFWGSTSLFNKDRLNPILKSFSLITFCTLLATSLIGSPWTPSINELLKFNNSRSKLETNQPTVATQLEAGGTESGQIRRIVWKGAFDVWKHYPIFGTGVETFAYSYYQFRPIEHNMVSEWDFLYNKAHNEYLNMAANSGTVGLLSYLTLIGFSIYSIIKPKSKNLNFQKQKISNLSHSFEIYNLRFALLAGYISILITNFFGFSVVLIGLLFFLFPALAITLATSDRQNRTYKKPSITQIVPIIVLLITIAYLLLTTGRYWYSDYLYSKGKTYNNSSLQDKAISVLANAESISPYEPLYHNELAQSLSDLAISYEENHETTSAGQLAKVATEESKIALELAPYNINLRRSSAGIFVRLSEINPDYLQNAIKILEDTLPLAPTDPKTHFQLGLNLARTGRVDEAIKRINEATSMKPDYKDARLALAIIYESIDKKNEARQELEYILTKISPNDNSIKEKLKNLK
jgi:O-antigen ligase